MAFIKFVQKETFVIEVEPRLGESLQDTLDREYSENDFFWEDAEETGYIEIAAVEEVVLTETHPGVFFWKGVAL